MESKFDVLGVVRKLVKYIVHFSKTNYKIIKFFLSSEGVWTTNKVLNPYLTNYGQNAYIYGLFKNY
jgi:hypothetical protein